MDPVGALADLGGFGSRATMTALGVPKYAIERALRDGRLLRISRGVYGLGLPGGREALTVAVAVLRGVASHQSAAAVRGLEMVTPTPRLVVTVVRDRRRAHAMASVSCALTSMRRRSARGCRSRRRCDLVGWVDFAYVAARLLVEADGFEFHRGRADYRKDRRRAYAYCRLGWRLLRFSWEDVRLHPDYVVEAIRFELAKRRSAA